MYKGVEHVSYWKRVMQVFFFFGLESSIKNTIKNSHILCVQLCNFFFLYWSQISDIFFFSCCAKSSGQYFLAFLELRINFFVHMIILNSIPFTIGFHSCYIPYFPEWNLVAVWTIYRTRWERDSTVKRLNLELDQLLILSYLQVEEWFCFGIM